MLNINNVSKSFGGVKAVNACTLSVEEGSITGLIGPNGAGKTTLFNVITGHYTPDTGTILFQGEAIEGLSPHQIFRKKQDTSCSSHKGLGNHRSDSGIKI